MVTNLTDISAICTSPADLIIARAPDDFKEYYLALSHIGRPASVYDYIGLCRFYTDETNFQVQ